MKLQGYSCTVTVLQGSVCATTGQKIITYCLEYPRAIHAQLLTHRVFSKNSSSTRAIPIPKAIEQLNSNPAKFIWTENQSGMQGQVIQDNQKVTIANNYVELLKNQVVNSVLNLSAPDGLNLHKQNVGRYLEPFQNIKIILTATEFDNWFWLRDDSEAQGEITELAILMRKAYDEYNFFELYEGEWHLPYVNRSRDLDMTLRYYELTTGTELTLSEAKDISMSCCAQVSYRNLDTTKEKADKIIPRLFSGRKIHASPSEHLATPTNFVMDIDQEITFRFLTDLLPEGVTHIDTNGTPWSGNFKNWIQYRQLIPNNVKK